MSLILIQILILNKENRFRMIVMDSNKITVTDGRLKQALKNSVQQQVLPEVNRSIDKKISETQITTGIITKFYPYLDKAEVELRNNKKIICKILHRFGGELIDFYTPFGEEDYCDDLHEPCVIPRVEVDCLIVDINDNSKEYLLVGYYLAEELIGSNPAKPGDFKIMNITGDNEYWIKFGYTGLDIRLPSNIVTAVGLTDDEMESTEYINPNEYYTKSEVDELIKKAVEEALNQGA